MLLQRRKSTNITSRCSTAPALRACAGQFLSRGFVVLLRKSVPQNHDLKTAAELGVTGAYEKTFVRSSNIFSLSILQCGRLVYFERADGQS
jgi:hypothetical protein